MCMSFGTIQAVTGSYAFECVFGGTGLSFEDCAVAFKDEYHLAAVFMGVYAYAGSRSKTAFEYTVCAVKEHMGIEFLFASLELREHRYGDFVKFYDHDFR